MYRGYFVLGELDPSGLRNWTVDQVIGPIQLMSGDIRATLYVDADRMKNPDHNPDKKRYMPPPKFVSGVEMTVEDTRKGEPCSDGCGLRIWASFKKRVKFKHATYVGPGKGDVGGDYAWRNVEKWPALWEEDAGLISSTVKPFYDYPSRGRERYGGDKDFDRTSQDYAVAIICMCLNDEKRW